MTLSNLSIHLDPPLDVSSAIINVLSNSNVVIVTANWTPTAGNFDPSHYIIQLFLNDSEVGPRSVSSDNNTVLSFTVNEILAITEPSTLKIQAKITAISKCNMSSTGVFSNAVTIKSGGTLRLT